MNRMERAEATPAPPPTFAEATRVWARIGLINFGGPAGQIALMHRVLVEERKWISEARFLHALNFCMLLPGPEAQQLATYVGWLLHGTRGGIAAGALFILPGFFVILALSTLYTLFHETGWLNDLFFGLKAAVLAIVIEAVVRIGRRALRTPASVALAAAAFLAIFALRVPFPVIVLGAGAIGWIAALAAPGLFSPVAHGDDEGGTDVGSATEPSWGRAVRVTATWSALWAAPVVGCGLAFGWDSIHPALGVFFSKMAVVTFGGAYAVLAYVADAAVASFHWLRPGEMLDGLAMAETTPGPLILVLTFVGFLAAAGAPGGLAPVAAGFVGATLVTWVTFVPSFLWIFLGAPYMEKLRGNPALAGGLAAITAAVVGVILNLALFLGLHGLFGGVATLDVGPVHAPWPEWLTMDVRALALSAAAATAIFWFRLGVVPTLALCCLAGVALRAAFPV